MPGRAVGPSAFSWLTQKTLKKTGMQNNKILLVDDRLENLLALQAIFDEPGYECVTAKSGREALAILLKDQDFLVILLDIQMPDMDGFETAKLILESNRTKDIPIIFITAAYTSVNDMLKGYDLNAVDYIVKPINKVLLKRKVAVFAELYQEKRHSIEELNRLKAMIRFSVTTENYRAEQSLPGQEPNTNFEDFVASYKDIFNKYLMEQTYKTKKEHVKMLKVFTERLGKSQATPKNLIEIHLYTINDFTKHRSKLSVNTYIEEGHMLLLEAMGELAAYYQSCVATAVAREAKWAAASR